MTADLSLETPLKYRTEDVHLELYIQQIELFKTNRSLLQTDKPEKIYPLARLQLVRY